ncbi:DUF1573 domain-containing protein [Saccharicrinis fermentans]|uniref:DUF1573 domain-containing protein n=1 Tax=Saccharicrinis fermentans DSM 9555 = JCM 21142 TaxID=869213 RepID=W7Y2Z4_9BACT|nr:DUF1573 domain-containing protein [Saccharicrinis fermentans]GAF05195.1 hypothetical protein JCM21142_93920 [Saccharicrinis fermentans DSM 9555 = JCM 21142]
MKKIILLFTFALLWTSATWAQQTKPAFSFEETLHNFGEVKEADGKVSHEFSFTNTGSLPLVIHNVRASCGCTSPEWSRKPIAPGGKGFVKATFDPRNRPGNFNKTITVTANTANPNTVLRITGNVTPRPKTLEDIYPREVGPLRFKTTHISFTRIQPKEKKSETIEFVNTSDQTITLDFDRVPKHISLVAKHQDNSSGSNINTFKPGEKGNITATYNAAIKNDWGFVYDQVFLKINGETNYKNRISVNANIQEDFSSWSQEQKAKAAKISVDNKIFDFGEIKQGEKAKHTYYITNTGKSDLLIRKVKASCGCTAIKPAKTTIAPGEKTAITAEFNSAGKSGRQNKSITVITNDPLASSTLLRIQGTVTK